MSTATDLVKKLTKVTKVDDRDSKDVEEKQRINKKAVKWLKIGMSLLGVCCIVLILTCAVIGLGIKEADDKVNIV